MNRLVKVSAEMRRLALLGALACAPLVALCGPHQGDSGKTNAWPFAILRNWGTYEDNRVFIGRAFAAQERHPGLIDEIWFCGGGDPFADPAAFGKSAADGNLGARAECRRLGISFAYQQGVTLSHAWDDIRRDGFPEDAWVVDDAGKTRYGLFCCTSPFVRDYSLRKAKAILDGLRPDAYWPDDDMRLYKADWSRPTICFCDRCVGLYNRRYGRNLDRVGLLAKLNGPEASADVRREWCAFNGTVLGEYAKVYRAAADVVCPGVRMGAQIALSGNAYDGRSWEGLIRSFAGRTGAAGIRPGGIYYEDFHPHSLVTKAIGVAREAARSSRLAETAQICYEAENWPHIGAQKSPGGMMSECALALASGCDSLALYWGSDLNAESQESYDVWFETFAAWKPFLLGVRDAFRGTRLGGVACFHGADHFATPEWINHDEPMMTHLACNALPVTVTEAEPDALFLNERSVRTLAESDLSTVFARPVLMDAEAFAALGRRFPALEFVRKVELRDFAELKSTVTGDRGRCYERFRVHGQCGNVKSLIYPKAGDVIALSEMTFDPKACGTCVVPTEFGGRVVVMQGVPGAYPQLAWSGSRRHGVLDALDLAVPGGMPARLLTDGYACSVTVRKTADGRTAGALILNLGTGETPPLELAIRRSAADAWQVRLPKRDACAAEAVRGDGRETVLRIPPLPAFGVALVEANGRAIGRDACVTVDFNRPTGRIRALNGGNLGPQFSNSRRLADGGAAEFGQLGVPSVRLHDVPLFNAGQRLVDTHFIFGNFACDPADPTNYYFKATDDYIRLLRASGSEPFYRLGISIEHTAGTYNAEPPADYAKWAEICCGIIRHYNRGWANGHRWNIRYWEIWNEADIGPAMWKGTFAEYCKLYEVVSKRIKEEFPEVKVGGPASVWFSEKPDPRKVGRDCHAFLAWCRDRRCPLDFYSWHHYTKDLKAIADQPAAVRRVLDGYGFPATELVLNEWHYGSGSDNCATDATAADESAGINAAVFCPAVLTLWQDTPIAMGHHYTIGPSAWGNGRAWGAWRVTDGTSEPRFRLFYTLRMFAGMLRHADRVAASSDTPGVTVLAGRDAQGRRAVLVSNLKSGVGSVRLRLKGAEGVRFRRVRTDAAHHEVRDEVTVKDGELVLAGVAEGLSACDYLYEPDDEAAEQEGIVTLKTGMSAVVSDHPEKRFETSWPLERPVSNGVLRVSADIRVPRLWGRKSASHWKGYPLRESALRIGLDGRLGEAGPTYAGNGIIRSIALEAGEDEGVPIVEARPLGDCTRGSWYRYVLEFDLGRGTYSVSAVRRDGTDAPGSVRDIRFAAPLPPGQVVSRVVASAQGILSGIGDAFVADDAGGFENVRAEWLAPGEDSFRVVCAPDSAAKRTGTDADIQRLVDASVGRRAVLPPGDYEIAGTIRIPSHTHLCFGGCRLRMKDGVIAPMFRNRLDADGLSRDIVLDGGGTGILDGGLPNGLDEHTSRKNGLPHVSENLTLYFTQLDGFEVRNFTVRDQRWWALMFLQCTKGRIAGVHFELTRHALDSRRPWRNQDGIDLRVGCSDIVIEDITGETGDDLIALTALNSPYFEQRHARADRPRDIRDITIRRVKGRTNQCALIRLLSHFGQKIEKIRISDVTEDSVPGKHNQTQMAIRIGDRFEWYYGRDERNAQRFGDICDVTVDGLVTRALTAVVTDDSIDRLTVRNVRLVADAGSVWCCGPWNIDIAPFIYIPEREGEVRSSRLVSNVETEWRAPRRDIVRARDVLFENVSCENVPHHGEAAFRFSHSDCENCVIRNVRLPEGRKKVELIETRKGPSFDDAPLAKFGFLSDIHVDQRHFGEPDVCWPEGLLYPF